MVSANLFVSAIPLVVSVVPDVHRVRRSVDRVHPAREEPRVDRANNFFSCCERDSNPGCGVGTKMLYHYTRPSHVKIY